MSTATALLLSCTLRCCVTYNLIPSLQSGGTRGDVQPSTALAITLSGLGATVAMATDASFKGFVQQHGLQHISLGGNARDMMALTVKWG